jgi:drug/metabolite transporter (DMT)-like permease
VLWQSVCVVITGAFIGWAIISYLQDNYLIGNRFIPAKQAGIMFAAVCIQIVISSLAVYLRAHKKEPFLWLSIAGAVLQGSLTWYLGMHFSSLGVTAGLLAVNLFFTLPAAYFIWQRCRANWHS